MDALTPEQISQIDQNLAVIRDTIAGAVGLYKHLVAEHDMVPEIACSVAGEYFLDDDHRALCLVAGVMVQLLAVHGVVAGKDPGCHE